MDMMFGMRVAAAPNFRADSASSRDIEYCRVARRLRCHYARQPHRMHGALQALSRQQNTTAGRMKCNPDDTTAAPLRLRQPGPARTFSDHVEAALEGGVLRYSLRMELLKAADRAGIGRFEANLIIAAVQHLQTSRISGLADAPDATPSRKGIRCLPFLIAFLAEATLLATAAWMWQHAL